MELTQETPQDFYLFIILVDMFSSNSNSCTYGQRHALTVISFIVWYIKVWQGAILSYPSKWG